MLFVLCLDIQIGNSTEIVCNCDKMGYSDKLCANLSSKWQVCMKKCLCENDANDYPSMLVPLRSYERHATIKQNGKKSREKRMEKEREICFNLSL